MSDRYDPIDTILRDHIDVVTETRSIEAEASSSSEALRQRCQSAALAAMDVLKMKACNEEPAHESHSLLDVVRSLASGAKVSMDRILETFQLDATETPSQSQAAGWANLAKKLGLSCEQTKQRLTNGFWKMAGSDPAIFIGARPRRPADQAAIGSPPSAAQAQQADRLGELSRVLEVVEEVYALDD